MGKNFTSLPDELVIVIIHQIDRSSLHAVSLCDTRLHALAEPVLYSTFEQTGTRGEGLFFFLRTLLAKPHLGRYVKHFVGEVLEGLEAEEFLMTAEIRKSVQRTVSSCGGSL